MQLYDYYRSSSSYRVRIALNLKQLAYTSIPVHLIQNGGEQHHADYIALNPQALVPTLMDQQHVLTQSLAIIEYLEESYPTPALLPTDPLKRADIRRLALLIACDIHPLNNLRVLNQLRMQFHANEEAIQTWYHHWLKTGFDALEQILSTYPRTNPVCYGSDISLADICLIPQVYNAHRFNFALTEYPLIQAIYAYCLDLSAFQRASPDHPAPMESSS